MRAKLSHGVPIALAAYSALSFGDALVKSLGGEVPVVQIGFVATTVALAAVAALKPSRTRWRDALRLNRPLAVVGRGLTGVIASFLGIVAFTRLPLSEAYSLMFLAPLLSAVLAAILLGERLPRLGWIAILLGFAGVLLVVRPGFAAVVPAHAAALGVAAAMAAGMILARSIAATEDRTAVLLVMMAIASSSFGTACLVTGAVEIPAPDQIGRLVATGLCAAAGQMLLLRAASVAPASRIAPAQYVQLIWATLFGLALFGEDYDALKLSGLLVIAAAGLIIVRLKAEPAATSSGRTLSP